MNYTYFLIDALLLLTAVFLLFSSGQWDFRGNGKFIILALFINVFVFSVPTEFLTRVKVIVFNPVYLSGIQLWELPVEELLFSLALPFCGFSIYIFLNNRFPANNLEKYSLAVSNIMMGICIAILYFGYHNLYTLITFFLLLIFILYVEYVNKIRFMYRFYRAYLVSLIPFYLVSTALTTLPVIQYNEKETLIFNVFHIPFESQFYYMGMLLLTIYLFETFKSRSLK